MTFLEALEEAKKGKKVRHNLWGPEMYLVIENGNIKMCNTQYNYLTKDYYISNSWEIYKEKILTDEEKEYISNIIKPFKNDVCHIVKYTISFYDGNFIQICVKSNRKNVYQYINLPAFTRDSMYKNMELCYKYSLKELDL